MDYLAKRNLFGKLFTPIEDITLKRASYYKQIHCSMDKAKECQKGHNYYIVFDAKNDVIIEVKDLTDMSLQEIEKWWENYRRPKKRGK